MRRILLFLGTVLCLPVMLGVGLGPGLFEESGGGHTIEDEGTPLTQRDDMNFTGAGVTATDAGGKTVVTIPGAVAAAGGSPDDVQVNIAGAISGGRGTLESDGTLTLTGTGAGTVTLPNTAGTFDGIISAPLVTADKTCNLVDGGWDCIGQEFTTLLSGATLYDHGDLPDGGTIYGETTKRMVPASNGNIKLGDTDMPWSYDMFCGPSTSFTLDDCTQGWVLNLDNISGGNRVNDYLPGFKSHAIENSYVDDVGTDNNLFYENNQSINFALVDVDVTAASGSNFTVGEYALVGTWPEAWGRVEAISTDTLTINFQGGTATPVVTDTITPINDPVTRTPGTPTAITGLTPLNGLFRTIAHTVDMSTGLQTWSYRNPASPIDRSDVNAERMMWLGKEDDGDYGAVIGTNDALGSTGLKVAGLLNVVPKAGDTYGILRITNSGGGQANIRFTFGTTSKTYHILDVDSQSAFAFYPDITGNAVGLDAGGISDGSALDTGTKLCTLMAPGLACVTGSVFNKTSGAIQGCSATVPNTNLFSATCRY